MKATISAALCVLFAATGAASAGEGLLGRLLGGGDRSNDVPKSIWQRDNDASGTHLQTRLKCPASAGAFKLTGLLATDGFGFDVWCQYDTTTRERITVFLTRREGESLGDHFEGAKTAITTTVPNAVASSEQTSFTSDPAWLSAVYDEGRLRTGVWVTDFSGWTFKFRATYSPAAQQTALDVMRELAEVAASSAGAHLSACAAAPMPERIGQRVTRTTDNGGTILGTMGTGWIVGQAIKQTPATPVWCMEKAFDNLAAPIQAWRNIAARDDATPVQRFTLMTVELPPTFDVTPSPGASTALNKARNEADKFRAHVLAVADRGPAAFAFFDGEPDIDAVATVVDNVLANKEQPVVYVNRQGQVVINLGDPNAK